MVLDSFLGSGQTIASLKKALEAGKLPHGILLAAPDGCGRGFLARCLAADYLFPEGGPAAQAVLRQQSPELLVVKGEGKSGQIPVERIRAVRSEVHRSSLSAKGRVVWIQDAHTMAAPAANALLKVLEEPPAGVLFILTTHSAFSLPMTIQSRCALYLIAPVAQPECEAYLMEKGPLGQAPELISQLAGVFPGRIGAGMAVLQDAERGQVFQSAVQGVKAVFQNSRYGLLCVFSAYEGRAEGDREKRTLLLRDMSDILAALMRNQPVAGFEGVLPARAAEMMPFIQEANQALLRNVSPKIVFCALCVRLFKAN